MKKTKQNAIAVSFEIGEPLIEKIIPCDHFASIVDCKAEIEKDIKSDLLDKGQSIMLSETLNAVKFNKQFKLISTLIKSKYE